MSCTADQYTGGASLDLSGDEGEGKAPDAPGPLEPLHSRPIVLKDGDARWQFVACAAMDAAVAAEMNAHRTAVSRASSRRALPVGALSHLAQYVMKGVEVAVRATAAGVGVELEFSGDAATEIPFAWTPVLDIGVSGDVHASGGFATEVAAAATALWAHGLLYREAALLVMKAVAFTPPEHIGGPADLVPGVGTMCTELGAAFRGSAPALRVAGAALASLRTLKDQRGDETFLPMWQRGGTLGKLNSVVGFLRFADRVVSDIVCEMPTEGKLGKVRSAFGPTSVFETCLVALLKPPEGREATEQLSAKFAACFSALHLPFRVAMGAAQLAKEAVRPGMADMVTAGIDDTVWFWAVLNMAMDFTGGAEAAGLTTYELTFARLEWLAANAPSDTLGAIMKDVKIAVFSGIVTYVSPDKIAGWSDALRANAVSKGDADGSVVKTNISGSPVTPEMVAKLV